MRYKHFLLFYLFAIVINCIFYLLVAEHYRQESGASKLINISTFLYPMLICIIMIITYESEKRLDFMQKFTAAVILITLEILTTIVMNTINPYERIISKEAASEGMQNSFTYGSIQLVILMIILFFIRSKAVQNKTDGQ